MALSCGLLLLGCQEKSDSLRANLGGEDVRIEVKDTKMQIYNGERVIAEITVASNTYFVKAFANGYPSVATQIDKWSAFPKSVERVVRRNGVEYLVTYDENGMVKEEIEVGPVN